MPINWVFHLRLTKTGPINLELLTIGRAWPPDISAADAEAAALALEQVQKWLEGAAPKKVVFVPGGMINIVV